MDIQVLFFLFLHKSVYCEDSLESPWWGISRVFPDSHFGSFYLQNLVLKPQILGAMVLNNAYMNNSNLISFIYGIVY